MASASNQVGRVVRGFLLFDAFVALALCSAVIRSASDHDVFDPVPSFPRTKFNEPRRLVFGAVLGLAALFRLLSISGSRRNVWLAFLSYFLEPALIVAYGMPPTGLINRVAVLSKVDPILQARLLADVTFILLLLTAGSTLSGLATEPAREPARPAPVTTKDKSKGGKAPGSTKEEGAASKDAAQAVEQEDEEPMSPPPPLADPLRALFETSAGPGATTLDAAKMGMLLRRLGQFDGVDDAKVHEATQREFRRALTISGVRRRKPAAADGERGADGHASGPGLSYEDFATYMQEVFKNPEEMAQEAMAPITGAEKQSSLLESYESQLKEIFTETLRPRASGGSSEKKRAVMGFATTGMDRALFLQTLRERHVIDANFTDHDADIAFQKAKPKTSNRINFRQFYTALLSISEKKRGNLNNFLKNFCEAQ